jgi:hypothetical protein
VILEQLAKSLFDFIAAILDLIPPIDIGTWDLGPIVSLAMQLDAHLPIHELFAAAALVLVVDGVIWLFDTFDWLYEKIPGL